VSDTGVSILRTDLQGAILKVSKLEAILGIGLLVALSKIDWWMAILLASQVAAILRTGHRIIVILLAGHRIDIFRTCLRIVILSIDQRAAVSLRICLPVAFLRTEQQVAILSTGQQVAILSIIHQVVILGTGLQVAILRMTVQGALIVGTWQIVTRKVHSFLQFLQLPALFLRGPSFPAPLPSSRLLAGPEALLGSVLVAGVLPEVELPQPLRLLYEGDPLLLTQLLPPLPQVLSGRKANK
jgi:hypothetical protein